MKIRKFDLPIYLILLIFFSCTDIYFVSGIKFTYIFTVFLIFHILKSRIKITNKDICLLLWYLSYFFAIGHIISMSDFYAVLIGQAILIVIYFYFKSIKSLDKISKIDYWFQMALYISVFVGIVQLLLYYIVGSSWGISHTTHGVGLPRMSGLCAEPDWYGVICMMAFIYMAVNIVNNNRIFGKKLDVLVCAVSMIMLILCLTRAAWVGCVGAFFVFVLLTKNKRQRKVKKRTHKYLLIAILCLSILAISLYFFNNAIFLKLLQRLNFLQWSLNDGGAFDTRRSSIEIMLYYFLQHPFTGNGVGSMAAIASNTDLLNSLGYYYEINAGRGNANIFITNLFDVGIFGSLFLTLFIVIHLIQIVKYFKKYADSRQLTYILLLIALLIDFQFNNGIRQAYVWILLGTSSAMCSINHAKGKLENENRN